MQGKEIKDYTKQNPVTGDAALGVDSSDATKLFNLGTAAAADTGTSGATVPLLNGANTHSGLSVFSAGIRLGADTTTLQDYEEGTWTPTITSAAGAFGTLTYNSRIGRYVRIGNLMYIFVSLSTSNVVLDTASGDMRVSTPVTIPNRFSYSGSIARILRFAVAKTTAPHLRFIPNTSRFVLDFFATNDSAATAMQVTEMTTGASTNENIIEVSGWFEVT